MIAGKEHLIFFEEQFKKQVQVYNDAFDFGIKIPEEKSQADTIKSKFRKNLAGLMKIYDYNVSSESWGDEVSLFVPFEQCDGDNKSYQGVRLIVLHVPGGKRGINRPEHFQIEISNEIFTGNPWNETGRKSLLNQ